MRYNQSRYLMLVLLCIALSGCVTPIAQKSLPDKNLVLFFDTKDSIENFFKNNIVLVSEIRNYNQKNNEIQLIYPSINRGSSPLYSHIVELMIPDDVPISVEEIIAERSLVVLKAVGNDRRWKLAGKVVDTQFNTPSNWFFDKPEFLYREP